MMHCIIQLTVIIACVVACSAQNTISSKHSIDRFLTTLLVHKNVSSTKKYLSTRVYSNKVLLSADCIGTPDQNATKEIIDQKITSLLKMIVTGIRGKNLKTILKYDWADDTNIEKDQVRILATPKKHGYGLFLAPTLSENVESDQEAKYLRSAYPKGPYLILFLFMRIATETNQSLTDYPVYFVWLKEKGQWKIVHINTVCM